MAENDTAGGMTAPRKGRSVLVFVIGFVLGAVVMVLARPFLGSRLPEAVGGKREALEGPVAAKQLKDDRLLLTIVTPAGAILGTFKKRVEEIDLLVETGDTIALTIPGYQPFLDDPEITRVAKPIAGSMPGRLEPGAMEPAPDSLARGDTLGIGFETGDTLKRGPASRWYD
jgi:hypothetical protein